MDGARGDDPQINHGWLYVDDLLKMLKITDNQLNLQIFRARKPLAQAGVEDAANLIERQPSNRALRIGVARCTVRS